ncbi:MAG: hypothetical protein ACRYGI_08140 [Janthinobacterium lividum]
MTRFKTMISCHLGALTMSVCVVLTLWLAQATANERKPGTTPGVNVPMTQDRWRTDGNVEFLAGGILRINDGQAALGGLSFGDGSIAFDLKPIGEDMPGIGFRQGADGAAEIFYLRTQPHCDVAYDCVQYTPQAHGILMWDIYPEYQGPAPVKENGWNHVKLLVSGQKLRAFVNGAAVLSVDHLAGDLRQGGLSLRAPALFANLVVTPGVDQAAFASPAPDATDTAPGLVRAWQVSTASVLPDGHTPLQGEMPGAAARWSGIDAERFGLVNLSRRFGGVAERGAAAVAWLKTTIVSDRDRTVPVSLGWTRDVWVFANGSPVFADKNLYYPSASRKRPDGTLSLLNGSFDLPLHKGKNMIEVALSNRFPGSVGHWGWGLEMRLDAPAGITLPAQAKGVP